MCIIREEATRSVCDVYGMRTFLTQSWNLKRDMKEIYV